MKNKFGTSSNAVLFVLVVAIAIIGAVVAVFRMDTTGQKGSGLGDAFDYDLSEHRTVDPALILYAEREDLKMEVGITAPRGIAVDQADRIYVIGNEKVVVFEEGKLVREIGVKGPGRTLAVDENGTIYAGVGDHIEVYGPSGDFQGAWEGFGPEATVTSVAVAGDNVFAAIFDKTRIVIRYDKAGAIINRIGDKDKERNVPGFMIPSPFFDLAMSPDGLLRVADTGRHRIEAFTFKGGLEEPFAWGRFSNTEIDGFCGCCNPCNFAILPDKSFVTCEKGLTRVKLYSPEGEFVGVVAAPEQFARHDSIGNEKGSDCSSGGLDVAVDSNGTILVLDPCLAQVRVFVKKTGTSKVDPDA
ncbi:MAG: hypothetical protein K9M57_08560 [Phycisphaerae bacterium]|nr:hypothetical protein [Phycisphaerae bacterium]